MSKEALIVSLIIIIPGITLALIQGGFKGIRRKAPQKKTPWFHDFGVDLHVDAVAMLMGVTLLATQPGSFLSALELIVVQLIVVFFATGMLVLTILLNVHGHSRWTLRLGLTFFSFSILWDLMMIWWLTA